jgi:hypothetical protein
MDQQTNYAIIALNSIEENLPLRDDLPEVIEKKLAIKVLSSAYIGRLAISPERADPAICLTS